VWTGSAADADHNEWDISKLDAAKLPPAAVAKGLTYDKDTKPILKESCFRCHGEDRQKGELRLDSREARLKGGENGKIIDPGHATKSIMLFASAQVNDGCRHASETPPRWPRRSGRSWWFSTATGSR